MGEDYRDPQGKIRTKLITSLGRMDRLPAEKPALLINGLNRVVGRLEYITDELLHDSTRTNETIFALYALWKDIELERALRSGRRRIDVDALVMAMVFFNRLCDLSSKAELPALALEEEAVAMPVIPQAIT